MRRALLDDLPFVEEDHAVGNSSGESHFVRHGNDRHAGLRELDHHIQYFLDHFGVKRRGRFIEQHDARLHGKGTCNRHALLLPARELGWIFVGLLRNAHAAE